MSYMIFRGVSTESLAGVAVSKMPSHKRAAMRYTEYYVQGRDGALHIDEGYSNMELEAQLVLIDAAAETRQLVNAWAQGTGKLILSDDPAKAYRASVKKEIKWTRTRGNRGFYDTARIMFDCEPYMYEAAESVLTVTETQTISNPGTAVALPKIVVTGSGNATFTIGGKQVTISNMSSSVPVTLDCENGYIFADSGAMSMTGEFPEIPLGVSTITVGSGVTSLEISPQWRWV